MRKTIVRTLAIGALLAVPFAGATAATAATTKAPSASGVAAIVGLYNRNLWPDDGPNFDQLRINTDASFRLGGKPDNLYDCYGVVKSTGTNKYVFSMHCEDGFNGTAKAEYAPKTRTITIHFSRGESFTR